MSTSTPTPARSLRWLKFRGVEVAGWLLVGLGLATLILPGPGLLILAAGLAVLSIRYPWARKKIRPVKAKALALAAQGTRNWRNTALSAFGGLLLVAVGIAWGVHPPAPGWWPIGEQWWLFGGWGTGTTLIFSGTITLGLVIYAFLRLRPSTDAPVEPQRFLHHV